MLADDVPQDILALAGLALAESTDTSQRLAGVTEALKRIDAKVQTWVTAQRRPSIARPYFNGFVEHNPDTLRDSTDYVFLSPELLAARYLLVRDLPKTRRFVLRVVRALIDNILGATASGMGGYVVQDTMIRTIDQAWAVDLLEHFVARSKEHPRKLLPSPMGFLSRFGVMLALWVVIVAAMIIVIVVFHQPAVGLLALAAGAVLTFVNRAYDRRPR